MEVIEKPADLFVRCAYVVPRKNRNCRMVVKKGHKFCGEHACFDPDNQFRIPCPNNSNHTVDSRTLEDHLSRCNSRLPTAFYVVKDINLRPSKSETVKDDLTAEIFKVSEILESKYEEIKNDVIFDCRSNEFIDKVLQETAKPKHLKQISSIIGHLLGNNLLKNTNSSAMFELGVGRGQLAYYMAKIAPESKFVLIDYSGVKHKVDNKLKADNNGNEYKIERIRCPIEHVDVTKLDTLNNVNNFSAVCKHFCGNATDYGVSLIIRAVENKMNLEGFCLVPCCRHRITFDQYSGADYLKSIGIDNDSLFAALRQISSWATCGSPNPTTATGVMESDDDGQNYKFWSYLKKLELGRKAQILIEFGRINYLRSLTGFTCKLLKYVNVEISPENLMIVGVKK